ncbi:MAG: adenosylcobalamin-dependent ribonucleoside-diphosphate reductase [Nanoarchaeota archaeon]
MQQPIQQIQLDDNARTILEKRYLKKDKDGNVIETPEEMFWRVAEHVSAAEKTEDRSYWTNIFYQLLSTTKFLPNSPTLINAGVKKGSLSACFTISPEDTMESIMQVAYDAALVEKWGGGIGFGFSQLRPRGDSISTTHGQALGVIATMKMYSTIGASITQGAFRLGAHMGQLVVSHPEILDFIHCKDNGELDNFNISVQITDDFMKSLEKGDDWGLINPHNGEVVTYVKAKHLWDELCNSAWKTGDPGVVFIDRVWETQPNPQLGKIQTSNPCGEENLENYGNCCLASIDLSKHLESDSIDNKFLDNLAVTIRVVVRFLDDVIEINEFPLSKLREMNLSTRRIGLGVMGWADLLVLLNIEYDSKEAFQLAETLGKFIKDVAWEESANLAKERGSFPEYENSALKINGMHPVRHSSVFTIAPTGSISRIAGCSSGIEPFFSLAWWSNILWTKGNETTKLLDAPKSIRLSLIKSIGEAKTIDVLTEIANNPEKSEEILDSVGIDPKIFSTALRISPKSHVKMQAAWQKNVTNSISKTINFPKNSTVSNVSDVYKLAWKLGCKGITVYRAGSREKEVLVSENSSKNTKEKTNKKERLNRPEAISGVTTKVNTGHGSLFATLNTNGHPFEVFSTLGKAGKCDSAYLEAISRLISLGLQTGISVEDITTQLNGITCCPTWHEGQKIHSVPDGIAYAMKEHFLAGREENNDILSGIKKNCPECSSQLLHQSGCLICQDCGWSKC